MFAKSQQKKPIDLHKAHRLAVEILSNKLII